VERRWRWPYSAIEHLVLRRADAAHAPNADVPRILRSKGMLGQPISVIPLGVDVDRFSVGTPMELPDVPRPRIGFVGRFAPVKGLDILVEAFRRLTVEASLVLAGAGSHRDTPRGDRVHILPPVDFERLPSFLKALDVLVLPSVTILPM